MHEPIRLLLFNDRMFFRYIHHTISANEICMQINPGFPNLMPDSPSHLMLTIESIDNETDEKTNTRFRCNFEGCPKTYSSAGNLKAHTKSHTGTSFIVFF